MRRAYKAPKDDQPILEEMLERYDYAKNIWDPIFSEGDTDMKFISGETWDDNDVKQRAGRLTLKFDQLGQYLNQVENAWRQNKRAIKVTPRGSGANDKTAEILANRIRQIEYESHATEAYVTAFVGALQRSTGFCRIVSEFESPKSANKVLRIKAIPNARQVLPDPDAESRTGADWKYLFYIYGMSRKEFQRKWPDAKTGTFSPALKSLAPDWHQEERVLVAEYWTVTQKAKKLLFVGTSEQDAKPMFEDEFKQATEDGQVPTGVRIIHSRMSEVPYVCKYITNGVELLEGEEDENGKRPKKYEWPGQHIPFAACYGKVLYMSDEGISKKIILSFIRLARDAQKYFNWLKSTEGEALKMPIRSSLWARRGQLNATEKQAAQDSINNPQVVLEYGSTSEETGGQILDAPKREMPDINIQAYEIAAEAARRDIQNALGRYSASVGRADTNVKSGVALKQLDQQSDQGSYHFTDAGDAMVEHIGEMLLDLIPHYDDTAKDLTVRDAADKTFNVRVNDPLKPTYTDPDTGEPVHVNLADGAHIATIGTGPAVDSERELASSFADALMVNMRQIEPVIGQKQTAKLLALTVKLKALGPIGDEMVNTISPPDDDANPQKMAQNLQAAVQRIQHAEAAMQQLAAENKDLKSGHETKLAIARMDNDTKLAIAEADRQQKAADREVKLAVAELGAKVKNLELFFAERERLGVQVHDSALSAQEHDQEVERLRLEHAHEAGISAADAGHDEIMGRQEHAQILEQDRQAADLAPEPAAPQSGV